MGRRLHRDDTIVLGRMTADEIHEIWPITAGVRMNMPDQVLDRLLDDMARITAQWRSGTVPLSTIGQHIHAANLAADRLLGITPKETTP